MAMCPIGAVVLWVAFCLYLNTPEKYRPERTPIISIALALLLASQVSRLELPLLRRSILFLGVVFSLVVLSVSPGLLSDTLSGSDRERFGSDLTPANVIFMPRVYYTIAFTCFVTMVLVKVALAAFCRMRNPGCPCAYGLFEWLARPAAGFGRSDLDFRRNVAVALSLGHEALGDGPHERCCYRRLLVCICGLSDSRPPRRRR